MNPEPDRPAVAGDPTRWGVFLFTDLEGSTRSWEESATRMHEDLAEHDRILHEVFGDHGGSFFSSAGDGFGVHFPDIDAAVNAAVEGQRRLLDAIDERMRVRIGIHAGVAYRRPEGWFGPCLNRGARIMSAGHGGQILVSQPIVDVLDATDHPGRIVVRDVGLHHLRDIPEPVQLWQIEAPGLPRTFPPLETVQSPGSTIPRPGTTFVGRSRELETIRRSVDEHPIVTIVAAGGMGKTRLAYEVAAGMAADQARATFVVELADSDPGDVPHRFVDAVLGDDPLARVEAADDPITAIAARFRGRPSLVVVDNCEHVIGEVAATIDAITRRSPTTKVLATSRVPLGAATERVVLLEPLPVGSATGPGPAVDLFIDRATAVRPGLAFDGPQLAAGVAICERVDGMPLGVELAAARSAALLPSEILPHLDNALRLLTDRSGADRPDRHRSLEATIGWSFDQLSSSQQDLLASMAVFADGFDAPAAIEMGRCLVDLDDFDTLDELQVLVTASLITVRMADGTSRYRIAEPVRQFAQARLAESGHHDRAERAHIDWYARRARTVVPAIYESGDPSLVNQLRADHQNFLSAMSSAADRGDIALARRMAVGLHVYWEESGHVAVGERVLRELVGFGAAGEPSEAFRAALVDPIGAQAIALLTAYASMTADLTSAERLALELTPLLDLGLPPAAVAPLSFTLGFVDLAAGRGASCIQRWTAAGDDALAVGDLDLGCQALWSAAYVAAVSSQPGLARELLDRADRIEVDRNVWFPHLSQVVAEAVLALTSEPGSGFDLDRSIAMMDAECQAVDDLGLKFRTLLGAAITALVMYRHDRSGQARRWWRRGLEIGSEMGHLWGCWILLEFAAWDHEEAGRPLAAAELWGALEEYGRRAGLGQWSEIRAEGATRRTRARAVDPSAFEAARERGTRNPSIHELVAEHLG